MNVGMAFAVIFTLIIIGFVLAVGMEQIQSFFCIGSDAQANKAVKDIEKVVEEVFLLAKGSGKTYHVAIPSGVKICFINRKNPDPHPYTDRSLTWDPDPIILEHFLRNPNSPQYGSNTWIYYCGKELGEGYKIKYLSPSKSFCVTTGRDLYIEQAGSSADISPLE
ncbi:MAG: hypothetical protein ISS93_03385 [Candidatus Aenigmarchaeota archaeon]|nr:hypothetical protein [Candidatus Aenigmarchaeota archaeon]